MTAPTTAEAQPQPWPHGLPVHVYLRPETIDRGVKRAQQMAHSLTGDLTGDGHDGGYSGRYSPLCDPYAGGYPSHYRPTAHLSINDVLWATRTMLTAVQANHTLMWPTGPTRDEDEVAALVKRERAVNAPDALVDLLARETPDGAALLARYPKRPLISPNAVAAEVLTHAFAMGTLAIMSSLQQLGLDAERSSDGEFIGAYALFDRPEWFDAIREHNIPLTLIHIPYALLGDEKFSLLLDLGYNYGALTKAAQHPETIDIRSLRTLLALRRPSDHHPLTGVTGSGPTP